LLVSDKKLEDKMSKKVERFAHKLALLGGRISYRDKSDLQYIDLEEFFLEATIYIHGDSRLANCIEHWIRKFGSLIGPSKVKGLIEKGFAYNKAILGVFLEIIDENKIKQINTDTLRPYCRPYQRPVKRNKLSPYLPPKYRDPIWEKYNIITHKFHDESKKNLLSNRAILKNCPELRYRILGCTILDADLQAYLEKTKDYKGSINSIAKRIHAHYANLYKVFHKKAAFGLLDKSYTLA
jgi:hypothetical protein